MKADYVLRSYDTVLYRLIKDGLWSDISHLVMPAA